MIFIKMTIFGLYDDGDDAQGTEAHNGDNVYKDNYVNDANDGDDIRDSEDVYEDDDH